MSEVSSVMGSMSDAHASMTGRYSVARPHRDSAATGTSRYDGSTRGAPNESENDKLKQYRDFVSRMQGYPVSAVQEDQRESTISQTERGSEAISANTSISQNSKSSLMTVTEGEYDEDRDYTKLDDAEWKFDDERQNSLQLPTKIRRDLKNSVIKRIAAAKDRYFKDAQKLSILDEDDAKFIRF